MLASFSNESVLFLCLLRVEGGDGGGLGGRYCLCWCSCEVAVAMLCYPMQLSLWCLDVILASQILASMYEFQQVKSNFRSSAGPGYLCVTSNLC